MAPLMKKKISWNTEFFATYFKSVYDNDNPTRNFNATVINYFIDIKCANFSLGDVFESLCHHKPKFNFVSNCVLTIILRDFRFR